MKKENKTSISIDEYNEGTPVDHIDKQNTAVVQNGLPLCCSDLSIQHASYKSFASFQLHKRLFFESCNESKLIIYLKSIKSKNSGLMLYF